MATKKDLEFSLQGGEQTKKVEMDFGGAFGVDEPSEASEAADYVIFKLVNNKNGGTYIPNVDDVVNPVTKKVERIRLLVGIDSIWVKDQKDVSVDYIRQNSRSLEFPRGQKILMIPKWDKAALEFAQICRHNIGAPNRKSGSKFEFFEYNPKKQAEAALKKEMLELDMAIKARELPEDKMKKMASFLGIRFVDDLGQAKPADALRTELMLTAKRTPELFEKYLDAKEVDIQFMIKKAILDSTIDLGGGSGNASWGTGGSIGKIPTGAKPLQYLTELAMTNSEEGRAFLEKLNSIAK